MKFKVEGFDIEIEGQGRLYEMRICSVDRIPDSAVLAKSIYDAKGVFLLKKDVTIQRNLAKKLKTNGIFYIYIQDDLSEGIEIETVIDDELKADIILTFKKIVEKQIQGNRTPDLMTSKAISGLENIVDTIVGEINSKSDLLYMTIELMGTDMSTYSHSVNTAIISLLIAMDMKLERSLCEDIGLGSILHDIGKVKIDSKILNKFTALTSEEAAEIRRHVEYGYHMTRNNISLSGVVKSIILSHHEKLDGSGYPNALRAEQIPLHVRIVTVADMFDAMNSDRSYKGRMPVHTTLEALMVDCVDKIDTKVYRSLVNKVVMYPPGTIVNLNEGSQAIIVKYNAKYPTRPKIRIIESQNFQTGTEIDLMDVLNLLIESTETP